MATKIIHKKSSTGSSVPVAGDLEPGELAINLADKKLYSKTVGGVIIELSGASAADIVALSAFTPVLTDIFRGVDDPAGTPVFKKNTYADARTLIEANLVNPVTSINYAWGTDLFLERDAANILAQRNGVNAQELRIFNTWTDASNYECGGFAWNGNEFILSTKEAGSGGLRDIVFTPGADLIVQRNGTWAQSYGIYNTFTDASNYERAFWIWNASNDFVMGTEGAGTGSMRNMVLQPGSQTLDLKNYANSMRFDIYNSWTTDTNYERIKFAWETDVFVIGTEADGSGVVRPIRFENGIGIVPGVNSKAINITGYSLTGADASNMVDLSGTWNTTGAPTLLYADVLDTASDAGAMLVNLKVGGVSMFSVTKAGAVAAISGLGAMSDAEVKTAYENNADTNEFSDAEQTSLATMEDNADVTDTANVTAAGAAMLGGAGFTVGSSHFNVQTGTSYTLVAGDNGKTVTLNNAAAIVLTVPTGLGQGFRCTLLQLGAGQVTVTASSTTLNSLSGNLKIAGQHGAAGVLATVANTFAVADDLVA